MICPFCGHNDSKVLETRDSEDSSVIRRRRECISCSQRFTTFERIEEVYMWVIKKDGTRERFDSRKILGGMLRACEKRPVSIELLEQTAEDIEREFSQTSGTREFSTLLVGEKVMERLKDIDQVAYVRFASVYREFKDISTFLNEIQQLLTREQLPKG
ncbi:MAG: transcriptional regulator NrdR [Oscillospiraceae bacterium]|nr:transcriptional regulator NrdR [Oscillospiraceae bacterium]